ncbi:uncharacterized protein TRAVEDRAFT_54089 [Trametes versicolor FP-101664 SS1]|uniref:Uncharacterized protein n=1 Tax=Trametes versicolor (strain FP-101664) TaxID=717944 RepID=R7S8V6_TRAVS|nr:uncharacterized protein TRAVEDRAFT_54089 [Trametes versicolor FP-101664 SS1]EIW52115.1 hypothetical protein TRAVEDRAFT_54089 [Trametes versicolor FP-101664 SS1]
MSESQRLITHCGNEIRQLVCTEKLLRAAMTDLRGSMIQSDGFTRRTDEAVWSNVDKLNGTIQEEAHQAAVQLSSAINIYLTMHDEVSAEEVDDLIVELDALKTEINGYRLDQQESLRIIIGHASQAGEQHASAVQDRVGVVSRQVEDANAAVSALREQLQEKPKCTPTETTRNRSDSRSFEESQILLVQGKLANAQKRLNAAQTSMEICGKIDWETTTSRFGAVLRFLKKEQKEMGALPELRKLLLNEVNAYLSAAESFKAYPGPRHTALNNMRLRLLSTAPAWRGVEELLATGYAKGHQ